MCHIRIYQKYIRIYNTYHYFGIYYILYTLMEMLQSAMIRIIMRRTESRYVNRFDQLKLKRQGYNE